MNFFSARTDYFILLINTPTHKHRKRTRERTRDRAGREGSRFDKLQSYARLILFVTRFNEPRKFFGFIFFKHSRTMSRQLLRNVSRKTNFQISRNLVNDSKYSFLKQLGIAEENSGFYDGKWGGSGKVRFSLNTCLKYWPFLAQFSFFIRTEFTIFKDTFFVIFICLVVIFENYQVIESISPATGKVIAKVRESTTNEASHAISEARKAWPEWASLPAPARGEIVRQIGDELRKNLKPLGLLVSLEMGKYFNENKYSRENTMIFYV